tara:strand:+ start:4465 stop:5325 length:861 start_codon:yes stop_codon:yes gene_type:complete
MTQIRLALWFSSFFYCFCFAVEQVSPPWGFVFKDWAGDPIDVIVYIPAGANKNTEILMVVPGASRDTQRFHASWLSFAKEDTFVVVTIGASKKYFPDEYSYNAGNVVDNQGNLNKKELWLFNVVEKIFNKVKNMHGFETKKFQLFGHSAGGGFVLRYMLLMPNAPAERAVAANPAFVTLPNQKEPYPFGLAGLPIERKAINSWLGKDLAIFLGEKDVGPRTLPLSNGPRARAQGPNCLSRGKKLYGEAQAEAEKRGVIFGWYLCIVPGVGHDNRLIAPHAREFLFN